MATIIYVPRNGSTNWNDPTIWSGGVVPNDPTVDVVMPTVTIIANGQPFVTNLTEAGAFSIGSLAISNHNLIVGGSLSITGALNNAGFVTMNNGVLSVGSVDNLGGVVGTGSINSSGLFLNEKSISGVNLTAAAFTNTGTISGMHLTVSAGGFTNLSGSTLSGGTYIADGGLYFDVGSVIAVDAAKILLDRGMIYSFDDSTHSYVPLTSTLHQIASTGTLSLGSGTYNWSDLAVDGSVTMPGTALSSTQLTVHGGGTVMGYGTIGGSILNDGKIVANGIPNFSVGPLVISSPVSGSGTLEISNTIFGGDLSRGTLELRAGATTSEKVVFQSQWGTLILDDPSVFSGHIVPTGAGDQILIRGISIGSVTGYSYSGDSSGGTLAVHTASGDLDLDFLGSFLPGNFALSAGPQVLSSSPPSLLITNTGGRIVGTSGNDSFAAPSDGTWFYEAGGGNDTITFSFRLTDAFVTYSGNTVIIDVRAPLSTGQLPQALPGHFVLSGFEKYVFTDGTVDDNDGNPLVDDLYYYSHNHDVWTAHADADQHYNQYGWHEGRDPNAFFSTTFYLSLNQDVKAAGVNPLTQFDQSGWKEGRAPSAAFDDTKYLQANPDIAAAHIDPLAHFLQFGAGEGRQPVALASLIAADGFDSVYYLQHNPDVQAAELDPHQHYNQFGWHEGRNPNALFDTKGYLATYTDVAAAHINPLDHYHQFGWIEGRDPSVNFDTTSYIAAYADVAAAHIDPLQHFLAFGMQEGRSAFADGVWG